MLSASTGPLHNQIPKPNRKVDNSTIWDSNFNHKYFDNMYFNRMADFYTDQSSGRYTIDGDVTTWVKVPFNEARYGSNNGCGSGDCGVGSCSATRWPSGPRTASTRAGR